MEVGEVERTARMDGQGAARVTAGVQHEGSMKRHVSAVRKEWQQIVESQGLTYHTVDGKTYWDESAYYELDERDAVALEDATVALWEMCLEAVAYLIDRGELSRIGIPGAHHAMVAESWRKREPSLYGRFDLAYDGTGPAKMLEFNADTPTSLVEAAVVQWYWMKDVHPDLDQFNTLHEELVRRWGQIAGTRSGPIHFSCMYDMDEDWMTINYLRDCAMQAGSDANPIETIPIAVEDIGWNERRGAFVDEQERMISTIFKLYPWEWMMDEPFAANISRGGTTWIEPAWKSVLSSKGILPVLWEMFPGHENLLEASTRPLSGDHVVKPMRSREGCNIRVVRDGATMEETNGPYDGEMIYQRFVPLRAFDGNTPTVGGWIVGDAMCGVGVREDASVITRNTSRFVPHVYVGG